MPTRTATPIGAPCWVDLMTSDVEGSRDFYTRLFGWTAGEPSAEFGGYFNFSKEGALIAGCMAARETSGPGTWSVYLATDDARKTITAATAKGGGVHVDAMEVGDLGTMGVVSDPGGASIGLWQPGAHKGFEVVAEVGAPSWFELHTPDYDQSLDFYRSVFAWTTKTMGDTAEFRYTTLAKGEEMYAGVMDSAGEGAESGPARWEVYFGVDDTDAALARVLELGGAVVDPAVDTPYGRLATAADPAGVRFRLIAPNESMPARS